MKKTIFILALCLFIAGPSFAQNNMEGMKFLTVNALMQYGQKLYDRGDFNEARAVFDRVLTYDDHQVQALQYLKDMGHLPVVEKPIGLKEAIEAEKKSIEELRGQIMRMRENLNSEYNNVK